MKYIRTKNGVEKFTDEEYQEYLSSKKKIDYKQLRIKEYGSIMEQMEFITENGLKAWQLKVREIKVKIPKPKTLTGM